MSALSPIRKSLERRRAPKLSPEKRREQLLRCALTVFARRGIGSARHAEIAQEAQVAVPTVFTYFPTREILVREVLSEVDQYLSQVVWSAIGAGNSVFEKLLLVTKAFGDSVITDPDVMKIWLNWSTAMRDNTWLLYEDLQTRVIDLFVEVIRDGQTKGEVHVTVDPEIAAYMVVSGGHMIVQMKLVARKSAVIDAFLEKLVLGSLMPEVSSSREQNT